MSVHYKFKSALNFDTITFDGLHISVSDLKKEIIHHKRLGKVIDFDLQITNAQTKDEYADNSTLIPKNTSLIIARVPLTQQPKKSWEPTAEKVYSHKPIIKPDTETLDLSQMNGTEEDKINIMMAQSTMDYDPKGYQKLRGQGQTGEVPPNYRCFKCQRPGHWIKNCPLNVSKDVCEIKRNTGIPRSFIQDKDREEKPVDSFQALKQKQEIPEDLICNICKDIFTDAVMIPCCGSSFCDECVRTALLESEDSECPDCKEKGSSPASLIPNRFLRNSVNSFKNETGYNRIKQDEIARLKTANKCLVKSDEIECTVSDNEHKHEEQLKELDLVINPSTEELEETEKTNENVKPQLEIDKGRESSGQSSHEDSDFEDNITVTVPPAYMQNHGSMLRDRSYNGNNARQRRPNPHEESTRHRIQPITYSENTPEYVNHEPEDEDNGEHQFEMENDMKINRMQHYYSPRELGVHCPRPGSSMYGPPMGPIQHHGNQNIMKPYNMDICAPRPTGYGTYFRNQYVPPRPGYINIAPARHVPHSVPSNLADVYKNVAQKVGTGIIEDPLATFNLLMKEREHRKTQKRSHNRHRSRSPERTSRGKGGQSRQWAKSPQDRGRSPIFRAKERSIDRTKDRRRRNSSSGSQRSSRSRSPKGMRKRSPVLRRRSWSRSPSFRNRSRSASMSRDNFKGPPHYFNHSPRRSISPLRYRLDDVQYGNRNNNRKWIDSPHVKNRAERSRGKSPTITHRSKGRFAEQNISRMSFEEPNRFDPSSDIRHIRDIKQSNNREPSYERRGNYLLDDAPPGTEPIPPGFEITQPEIHGYSNKKSQFEEGENNGMGKCDYSTRGYTPEIGARQSTERAFFDKTEASSGRYDDAHRKRMSSQSPRKSLKISSRRHSVEQKHGESVIGKKNNEKRGSSHHKNKKTFSERRSELGDDFNSDKLDKEKTRSDIQDNQRDASPTGIDSKPKKIKDKKKKKKDDKEKKKSKKDKKDKDRKDRIKSKKVLLGNNVVEMSEPKDETNELIQLSNDELIDARKDYPNTGNTDLKITNEINKPYDGICDEDAIEVKKDEISKESEDNLDETNTLKKASSPHDIKQFDSVLDIYDFEQPLDDFNMSNANNLTEDMNKDSLSLGASKWELDDDNLAVVGEETDKRMEIDAECVSNVDEKTGKVTTEILRRAENAIFTKAINAIRSIEIKKISADRQKFYSSEKSPISSSPNYITNQTDSNELKSVHITVPTNDSSAEKRSVEIKCENNKKEVSNRSIKNRLGRKIQEPNRSRSSSRVVSKPNFSGTYKIRSDSRSRDRRRHDSRSRDYNTKQGILGGNREGRDARSSENRPPNSRDDSKSKSKASSSTRRDNKSIHSQSSSSGRRVSEQSERHSRKRLGSPSENKHEKRSKSDKNDETPGTSKDRQKEKVDSTGIAKDSRRHRDASKEVRQRPELPKNSSESSSTSSDSDSSSNSDDNRSKRKRKHKSKKKRAKSASESRSSPKSKKGKSKKKNKSSKKTKTKKDE